jgi:hypothetical protein
MGTVPRFGENLRRLRQRSRERTQEGFAPHIPTEKGKPSNQSYLAKLEAREFAPKATTVARIAKGVAELLGEPFADVMKELLAGVPTRYDAVLMQREEADRAFAEQVDGWFAELPPEQHDALKEALTQARETFTRRLTDTE